MLAALIVLLAVVIVQACLLAYISHSHIVERRRLMAAALARTVGEQLALEAGPSPQGSSEPPSAKPGATFGMLI